MARVFSNLQTTANHTAFSASMTASNDTIDFNIGDQTVDRYINGTYASTNADASGIIEMRASYPDLMLGTNTIKLESSSTTDVGEWSVEVSEDTTSTTDDSTPTFNSNDINVTFYGGTGDGTERVKFDGFDPANVDSIYFEYTLSSETSISGTFSDLSSSPYCVTLQNSGEEDISTFDLMTVTFADGSTTDIITSLDYANDSTIQTNAWPGECVEGDGSTSDGGGTTDESLGRIADALESIASTLAGGITVRPEPSKEWAFNRAATVNALREAQQLENVFNEMLNPTKVPDAGYESQDELDSKPSEFFRPESEQFDPTYEDRSCPFDPIPPEELEPQPTEEPEEEPEEESCHPPY